MLARDLEKQGMARIEAGDPGPHQHTALQTGIVNENTAAQAPVETMTKVTAESDASRVTWAASRWIGVLQSLPVHMRNMLLMSLTKLHLAATRDFRLSPVSSASSTTILPE